MSVELRPLGVRCNLACEYCYQNPQRDAGNVTRRYDLEAMKQAIVEEGGPFTLFGGEPLLVPKKDLEALWSWGLETFGENGIQTNGVLIDDDHLQLFRRCQVQVGISMDGPGALNDLRRLGSLDRTRAATEKVERAIESLCSEGLPPSLIVTLHRGNAALAMLPRMCAWFRELESMGVRAVRLHLLESENESVRAAYALTPEENIAALRCFADLETELEYLRFDVFSEVRRLLVGDDRDATCVWRACDPYTTAAVRGVEGFGQRSNCGRTNKLGIDFVKSASAAYTRYLVLYQLPQEHGGCQGCRFFLMCKGHCPGTALEGDWRYRTEHCETWKALFSDAEARVTADGSTPWSLHPERSVIEEQMVEAWTQGRNPRLHDVIQAIE